MTRNELSHDAHVRRQRGFTLLEVLVAILVLSIGLLGLAMLQVESLKYNTDAYYRTQATMLAYEIIDRMRANSAAAKAGSYVASAAPSTTETCGNTTSGCADTTALANYDLGVWYSRLGAVLPADSTSSSIAQAGNTHTVIIRWKERDISKSRAWNIEL